MAGPFVYFVLTIIWCIAGHRHRPWRIVALVGHIGLLPLFLIFFDPRAIVPFGVIVFGYTCFSLYVVSRNP